MVNKKRRFHFIGIGGIGMSALARYFLSRGWNVSGSDTTASDITRALKKEGVTIHIGHNAANVPKNAELVVRSQAIKPENPEVRTATNYGVRSLPYPEAIKELISHYRTVAIAGAHGKSTTTALSALTLIKGGIDPTVVVGTNLKEFGGTNFRRGKSNHLVLEADEFGKAFLHYSPAIAIVTNIDREHLDVYKNLANVKKNFLKFLSNALPQGTLILNRDNKNLFSLHKQIAVIAKRKNLRVTWYSLHDPAAKKIRRIMRIPGDHNVSNAMAAYTLGKIFAIPEKKILASLHAYRGSWRRMEYKGIFRGGPLFDDYAHHPTEIKATLKAFREKYPGKKIVCVFQPHQARRLKELFPEFTTAFHDADVVFIVPVYKVAGREGRITHDSEALAHAMQKREPKKRIFYIEDPKNIRRALQHTPPSSVVIMMGAGDIVNYTGSLL